MVYDAIAAWVVLYDGCHDSYMKIALLDGMSLIYIRIGKPSLSQNDNEAFPEMQMKSDPYLRKKKKIIPNP